MDALTVSKADFDFTWGDYLEETKAHAVPPTAFLHVEHSLTNSFNIGMKLEVPNSEYPGSYWIASIVMTCGPLLTLRYLGLEDDRSSDFWFDTNNEFHPLGWCKKNSLPLCPPKVVKSKCPNVEELIVTVLENEVSSNSLLNYPKSCMIPVDQIKENMIVEVWEQDNYLNIWPATIVQNVGGRLLLQYYFASPNQEFWLFYLSERIHPVGWASQQGIHYVPPKDKGINIDEQGVKELEIRISQEKEANFPEHLLEPQLLIETHGFTENMKLEIINPFNKLHICIGTVTKVLSDKFFVVDLDILTEHDNIHSYPSSCCHSLSTNIFPCGWAEENNLTIKSPAGYSESQGNFKWKEYLSKFEATIAPKELFNLANQKSEFNAHMKLEAVHPLYSNQIHVATVQMVFEPLLWISIDSLRSNSTSYITTVDSLEIFPVGWCASNGYHLESPPFTRNCLTNLDESFSTESASSSSKDSKKYLKGGTMKSWCPKIYFNYCCFTGPHLSKTRLAELPQAIGPGPIHLVMKDVLTRLINIAYKSNKILRELQICGKAKPNMIQQTIKAKYKGKSFRAVVEFVRNSEEIEKFCRQICLKLDCCPNLFGPIFVGANCPESCHSRTKTTFPSGSLKNKKKCELTVASAFSTNDTSVKSKSGPGRKKRKIHWRSIRSICDNNCENEVDSILPVNQENKEDIDPDISKSKEPTPQSSDGNNSATSDQEVVPIKQKQRKLTYLPNSETEIQNTGTAQKFWGETSVPSFYKRRGRPPGKHISILQTGVKKKKGRPFGSTSKNKLNQIPTKSSVQEYRRVLCNRSNDNNLFSPRELRTTHVGTNPMTWTVDETVEFIKTTEFSPLAPLLRDNDIDGQSLLLLDVNSTTKYFHLERNYARKFCSLIEIVKLHV